MPPNGLGDEEALCAFYVLGTPFMATVILVRTVARRGSRAAYAECGRSVVRISPPKFAELVIKTILFGKLDKEYDV
ncbi:hypothetical protein HG15A2_01930 [Adhaeretor mobilis]|uniref:Uncharacterized protein n=1 Tax=Adhaeretor mobilis TaxID=1930276 RepID=A0A517MPY5_9BACT|nr:hypothetical protein HG15A2_01930 [Adhaeretor mobilis]